MDGEEADDDLDEVDDDDLDEVEKGDDGEGADDVEEEEGSLDLCHS